MSQHKQKVGGDEIIGHCVSHGLQVVSVEQKGTVLVLHPKPGAPLPAASVLAQIADDVDVEGVRYVTVSIDSFGTKGGDHE